MTDLAHLNDRVASLLQAHLERCEAPPHLKQAMCYSVLNGGKRVRAMLAYLSAEALGADLALADAPASAIEFVHAYSLIHDDLPAMDDDNYRRGKPSCHIEFDEATAILTGDALQALGFQTIAEASDLSSEVRVQLISDLSRAIGGGGMVAGQIHDLANENRLVSRLELERMHSLKTGALISFSVKCGGIVAGADAEALSTLGTFGSAIGLAFQIKDDILDEAGEESDIGKPRGSDADSSKSTFVTTLGMDAAEGALTDLLSTAKSAIAKLGPSSGPLQQLADFVVTRNH